MSSRNSPRHDSNNNWMRTPMDRFVRGGQTINLQVRETIHLIKIMLLVSVGIGFVVFIGWLLFTTTSVERDSFLSFTHIKILEAMNANPDQIFSCPKPDGTRINIELKWCLADPSVSAGWRAVANAATDAAWVAGAIALIAMVILFVWFKRFGQDLIKERRTRGAEVVSATDLNHLVDRSNMKRKKDPYFAAHRLYKLAGVSMPLGAHNRHVMVAGTTGTGKSQFLFDLMAQIRANGDRAIIFDKTGAFIERFYSEDAGDRILNPLDARCAPWSMMAEASNDTDFDTMAHALIPDEKSQDRFWPDSARSVLATALSKFKAKGITETRTVVDFLLTAKQGQLNNFFSGTLAARSISSELGKTSGNIMAVLAPAIRPLTLLPCSNDDPFSIREWVGDDQADNCLFLSARSDQIKAMRGLITLWFDTAIKSLLSLERKPGRTIWFILDEFAALNAIPSLVEGLQESRQYGGAFVLGVQDPALVRDRYGADLSQAITGLCRTKVIYGTGNYHNARDCADWIGQAETLRAEQSMTYGPNDVRDAIGVHSRTELTHIVLPEQIFKLEDLHGFLSYPEAFPVASIRTATFEGERRARGFVLREEAAPSSPPSDSFDVADDGSICFPNDDASASAPESTKSERARVRGASGGCPTSPSPKSLPEALDPASAAILAHEVKDRRRLQRLRGAGGRSTTSGKQSDLFEANALPEAAGADDSDAEAKGGRTRDLSDGLALTSDQQILAEILEEDEAVDRKRREAHDARLERERETMSARRMRDSVRRDQIDIALDPDDAGL
ncbi:MAG: type IV secretion system DNA-binding domain-containing protein [Henriciella sp.]|nr:type IV secretion system DNA-binding domain-containing protein [Henriciella sp.]